MGRILSFFIVENGEKRKFLITCADGAQEEFVVAGAKFNYTKSYREERWFVSGFRGSVVTSVVIKGAEFTFVIGGKKEEVVYTRLKCCKYDNGEKISHYLVI